MFLSLVMIVDDTDEAAPPVKNIQRHDSVVNVKSGALLSILENILNDVNTDSESVVRFFFQTSLNRGKMTDFLCRT